MLGSLKTIYEYRDYLIQSVKRDISKQYKRSVLGYFWSFLNPLLMMFVLTAVFSTMMKHAVEHYAVFLFAGMIPWAFFSTTCQASLKSISRNARIISQIPVPKYLFVLSIAIVNTYTFLVSLLPLIIVSLIVGHKISWGFLLFPICFIPLFFITLGLSLFIATLNVFFEDTEHLTSVIIRVLYFMCPIIYPAQMLSKQVHGLLQYNPLFTIISMFKDTFYYGQIPSIDAIFYAYLSSLIILILGALTFKKAEAKMIYFV